MNDKESIKSLARKLWFALNEEGIKEAEIKVNRHDEENMVIKAIKWGP